MKYIVPKICKNCGQTYNPKEVARVYGKESVVYFAGYCSARCYTIKTVKI